MRNDKKNVNEDSQALALKEQEDGENDPAKYPKLTSGASAIARKFAKDVFFVYLCVIILGLFAIGSKLLLTYLESTGFNDPIVTPGLKLAFYFAFVIDVLLFMIVTVIMAITLIKEVMR